MSANDDSPRQLGDYELLTKIAQGGMADIFLARQTGLGGLERVVVIKRIQPEYAEDPEFTEMFLREARIVARINDPNVVRIFELGEHDGDYFLAMEYIHGLTVAELITRSIEADTWLPLDVSAAIVEQACQGLHQVHEVRDFDGERMGLIHRDVSHQNFLCTEDGFVKLIDFGIAKSTESEREATHSGTLKGKYAYMSPEQCARRELDRRSDVFSVGIVAWELFTGERLFKRADKLATIEAITEEAIPPASAHNPRLPEPIDRAILRALEPDPGDRYQSAAAFRAGLLDATDQAGMEVDRDRLGDFVDRVAGEDLDQRRRELREAVDREANTDLSDQLDKGGLSRRGAKSQPAETSLRSLRRLGPPLLVVALAALLGATGWYVFATGPGEPLAIGRASTLDGANADRELESLRNRLGERLGRPVEFRGVPDPETLVERLRTGQLAYALVPPLAYVEARRAGTALELLAAREFDGERHLEGVIVVPKSSAIESFAGLEGRRICLTDRAAPTGNILVRAHLANTGRDTSFFGPIQWSGTHERVFRDVRAGRCAAGATSSAALAAARADPDIEADFRRIATTGTVPNEAVVAGPEVSEKTTGQLRDALLGLDGRAVADGASLGRRSRISGFAEIEDGAYQGLREALQKTSSMPVP